MATKQRHHLGGLTVLLVLVWFMLGFCWVGFDQGCAVLSFYQGSALLLSYQGFCKRVKFFSPHIWLGSTLCKVLG
jgi:hypothetical protein